MKRHIRQLLLVALLCSAAPCAAASGEDEASIAVDDSAPPTLFGGTVTRDGLHLQATFGWAVGADAQGLFHAMELGYTLDDGGTVTYLYTLLQSKGFGPPGGGPDRLEGHLLALKLPLHFPELVAKVAVGVEVIHGPGGHSEQGIGWLYGVDLHLPIGERSGFTVGVTANHATTKGYQHWSLAVAGGYTCF